MASNTRILDTQHDDLEIKTNEYKTAIEKYNNVVLYQRVEIFIAVAIIALQILTSIKLFQSYSATSMLAIILTIFAAYIATDFISGLVHMMVDNNTNYASLTGPFVAAFHLHHANLIYQNNHPLKIYFYESGHKFWLFFYLLILCAAQFFWRLNFCFNLFLVVIGILSSVSELSHFWCHNGARGNKMIRFLQKNHILLSMKHHKQHHRKDNMHYAFLNGMTDCFLNIIAHHFYRGYKNHSDKHVENYKKQVSKVILNAAK